MTPEEFARFKAQADAEAANVGQGTATDTAIQEKMTPSQRQMGRVVHSIGGSLASQTALPWLSQGVTAADNFFTGGNRQPLTAEDIERGIAFERQRSGTAEDILTEAPGNIAGFLPFAKGAQVVGKGLGLLGTGWKSLAALGGIGGFAKEAATNTVPDIVTGAEDLLSPKTLLNPLKEGALEAGGGAVMRGAQKVLAPAFSHAASYGKAIAPKVLQRAQELVEEAVKRGTKLTSDEAALAAARELGDTAAEGEILALQKKLAGDIAKTGKEGEKAAIERVREETLDPMYRHVTDAGEHALGTKAAQSQIPLKHNIGIDKEIEELRKSATKGDWTFTGKATDAPALEAARGEIQRRMEQTVEPAVLDRLKQQLQSVDNILQQLAPDRFAAYPHLDEGRMINRLQRAGGEGTRLPPPSAAPESEGALRDLIKNPLFKIGSSGGTGAGLGSFFGPVGTAVGGAVGGAIPALGTASRALERRALPSVIDMSMNDAKQFLSTIGQQVGMPTQIGAKAATETAVKEGLPAVLGAIPDIGPIARTLFGDREEPEERLERRSKGRKQRSKAVRDALGID